jgi:hypothetical protein
MANTTWNPSDKGVNTTLTGGNLVATAAAGGNGWVRAVDRQVTGKFYWEITATTFAGTASATGIASATSNISGGFANPNTGQCGINRNGAVFVDGTSQGLAFGTITAGTVICIAVDLTARLIWFRLGAAGNWNTSASANPATGVGGVAVNSLGVGIPAYPATYLFPASDATTANFGDAAFAGTVPAGFTAGFTSAASPPTNELITQVAVEQWGVGTPVAQLTQVAVEQWVLPSTSIVQLTQVAIEEWATLAIASPTGASYALPASRAGIGSAVLWQTSANTYALPLSAIVAEATASPAPPVGGGAQARVMVLA